MKALKVLPIFVLPVLIGALSLTSCENAAPTKALADDGKVIINILHQEDYMDNEFQELDKGQDPSELAVIKKFEQQYPNCRVVFNTSETNETVYNELKTGKADYSLVTVSEYMIQRMASENLIKKINLPEDGDYRKNVSHYLTDKIQNIQIKSYGEKPTVLGTLDEYTVGYMWGTLGIVVNPNFYRFKDRGMSKDSVVEYLKSKEGWHGFWNKDYKMIASVKDSMRDTYAMGVFEEFKDEFGNPEISKEDKQARFNDHSSETIRRVKDKLIEMKSNIYGFEVDSGKNDILTGDKIGMNLAWSGDAGFSIYQGEFTEKDGVEVPRNPKDRVELYYCIPELGSNIWFDGFAMPSRVPSGSLEEKYTKLFLDFMCRQDIVVQNMSYTGYTSFMCGPAEGENLIRNYVKDTFDMDESEPNVTPYDVSYFFNGGDMVLHTDKNSFEGRALVAQYPEESDIEHLYIMEDYGEDNGKIVQMWEDIKVNPLPLWAIIILVIFVSATLIYLASYSLIKKYKVKKRKALRNK